MLLMVRFSLTNTKRKRNESTKFRLFLVKELCDEIKQCKVLKALRLEGNTINEEAATAIGKALEKHSEIEVKKCLFQLSTSNERTNVCFSV